ncbi:MAG: purine-nucleoside phosphorylase [Phaeodactylibacter sp.]|uniref:purine-nucleoside phosphorylase n=1 Tax=Phaeodactylibacter sp. TaxID=1940289 RepID=UPI0032EE90AA
MSTILYDQIQEAVAYIKSKTAVKPKLGIILGTGLSNLADHIDTEVAIPYADIPHFPVSTVQSHQGKLVFGQFQGIPVMAMAGRFHYYEGYTAKQITFPVRVMAAMQVQRLVISNAAGSVNANMEAGDIVFVRDHINLHPENPLRGENDERLGPRFPDMLNAYDRRLNAKGLAVAKNLGIRAHEGVYLSLQGPNLETPAEYKFAHVVGADLVGMSTVPEVLVARHANLPVLVLSVATNKCYPIEELTETSVEEVIAVAQGAEPKMREILSGLMPDLLPEG